MTDRLIRITTALAVVAVAGVAAIISYEHAYELVTPHGETGHHRAVVAVRGRRSHLTIANAGSRSQRAISRELNIDRRKVKKIIARDAVA